MSVNFSLSLNYFVAGPFGVSELILDICENRIALNCFLGVVTSTARYITVQEQES